jgi:hypothetical protein
MLAVRESFLVRYDSAIRLLRNKLNLVMVAVLVRDKDKIDRESISAAIFFLRVFARVEQFMERNSVRARVWVNVNHAPIGGGYTATAVALI